MAEHLVPVHSSLSLDAATRMTEEALRLRRQHQLLPLAMVVLDAGGNLVRQMHPSVLAVTGPHATQEVMDAVHANLPRPHDPFTDLVPAQGIRLTVDIDGTPHILTGVKLAVAYSLIGVVGSEFIMSRGGIATPHPRALARSRGHRFRLAASHGRCRTALRAGRRWRTERHRRGGRRASADAR